MSLFVKMKNEWNWQFHKTLKASSIDSSSQDNYTHKKHLNTRTGEKTHFSTWESLKISQQMCPDLLLFGLFYLPHLPYDGK